jgi:hypothetical protein
VFIFIQGKVVLVRKSTQFFFDAVGFIFHVLFAVRAGTEAQGRREAWCAMAWTTSWQRGA